MCDYWYITVSFYNTVTSLQHITVEMDHVQWTIVQKHVGNLSTKHRFHKFKRKLLPKCAAFFHLAAQISQELCYGNGWSCTLWHHYYEDGHTCRWTVSLATIIALCFFECIFQISSEELHGSTNQQWLPFFVWMCGFCDDGLCRLC